MPRVFLKVRVSKVVASPGEPLILMVTLACCWVSRLFFSGPLFLEFSLPLMPRRPGRASLLPSPVVRLCPALVCVFVVAVAVVAAAAGRLLTKLSEDTAGGPETYCPRCGVQ